MAMKISIWDEEKTKLEISKRFKNCQDNRSAHENKWIRNENTLYSTGSDGNASYNLQTSMETNFHLGLPGIDNSNADAAVAYTFKNLRFIHAQMSANPPSVAMRPTSSDQEDHRRADAADRIVRWSIRHYFMQEKVDQLTLTSLSYGTGLIKTVWDCERGDVVDFNEKKDEIELEGDIAVTVPFIWNMYIDPDAKAWDEVKYVIEKTYIDFDEACARWPDKIDILKTSLSQKRTGEGSNQNRGRETQLQNNHYNVVELLEYWETGLPTNGYLGRYCLTNIEGDSLEPCRPSPFRFKQAGAIAKIEAMDIPEELKQMRLDNVPEKAELPYHILTDIDMPNMVWGRSFVEYAAQLQDNLNRIDSAVLDNIQAHGVARMILPEAAEISEDSLGNSPWDITKITGNQPPYFMGVPQLMPEMTSARQNHIQGINDVCGVNEAMFGQQSREQSGASMQYATNQGNMIRRRMFNKYVLVVESIYKAILNLIRKHWTVEHTIHVVGKERALEAVDYKGADIDGGYDVIGEYGVTLSLDPITRREEIMTLQPLFEKAGVPGRTALKMMKLNELEPMYDSLEKAESRQREIFDEMIATGKYIEPKKWRDHENMIAWAMDYFMTIEFETLPDDIQQLCEQHIQARAQLAATENQPNAPTQQGPGLPPGPTPSAPVSPTELPTPATTAAPAPGG